MTTFGEIIKSRRKLLRISQRDLAAWAGVGINTLTKIERGEANPTVKVLSKILNILGMELSCQVKKLNDETSLRLP